MVSCFLRVTAQVTVKVVVQDTVKVVMYVATATKH